MNKNKVDLNIFQHEHRVTILRFDTSPGSPSVEARGDLILPSLLSLREEVKGRPIRVLFLTPGGKRTSDWAKYWLKRYYSIRENLDVDVNVIDELEGIEWLEETIKEFDLAFVDLGQEYERFRGQDLVRKITSKRIVYSEDEYDKQLVRDILDVHESYYAFLIPPSYINKKA